MIPVKETIAIDIKKEYSSALYKWKNLIPDNTPAIIATYKQGKEMGNSEHGFNDANKFICPFGIVLEGRAELYEMFVAGNFVSYRPIRIMTKGELFGDFSLLDKCQGIDGSSRSGESWKICSGFKSCLVTQMVDKEDFHIFQKHNEDRERLSENIYTHLMFDIVLQSRTIIAFFESSFVKRNEEFYYQLLDYSWPRAKIYRDCLNSFNYLKKLEFESHAMRIVNRLLSSRNKKREPKYTNKISKTKLLPIFIEALFDTCNRPLRREPMFINNNSLLISKSGDTFKTYGLKLNNIFFASNSYEDLEFWFPIDIANYMIASFTTKSNRLQDANLVHELERTLGGKREIKNTQKLNSRTFYKDLANKLLNELITISPDYPFNVECVEVQGIERRHLFLRFEKKALIEP